MLALILMSAGPALLFQPHGKMPQLQFPQMQRLLFPHAANQESYLCGASCSALLSPPSDTRTVESSLYPSTRSSSTTCAEYAFQCESVFFLFTSERTASVPSYFPCYRIVSDSSSPCPQGKWVGYYIAAGSTSRIVAPLLFAYFFQYFGPKYTHTLYTPSSSILCSFSALCVTEHSVVWLSSSGLLAFGSLLCIATYGHLRTPKSTTVSSISENGVSRKPTS